jgi:hypothetical protein
MTAADPFWRCDRCDVTTRQMPGHERTECPESWVERDGSLYCLGCQRDIAADRAVEDEDGSNVGRRAEVRRWAVVEFEIQRDPERSNGEIARAIRSSVPAVTKARKRLEARWRAEA